MTPEWCRGDDFRTWTISAMTATWSPDDLERIGSARELQIAVKRDDGTLRRWVPIWVVLVDEQIYVRTWYRRETGWFGQVLSSHRARIRVPGLETDVAVKHIGRGTAPLRTGVDAAYRTKYGSSSSTASMVTPEAAATTLQLSPEKERNRFLLYSMGPLGTSARPLLLHTMQAFMSCKFSLDAEC
jgi:hypothetical protein